MHVIKADKLNLLGYRNIALVQNLVNRDRNDVVAGNNAVYIGIEMCIRDRIWLDCPRNFMRLTK